MMSDLNMSHWKISDFVLLPFLGFTLVIKLRNYDFESHWDTLVIFDGKKWCQIWLYPDKMCLIWFKLLCLNRFLAISWEIQIWSFVEIV